MEEAIYDITRRANVELHNQIISKIYDRFVDNDKNFYGTKDTIKLYCELINTLLSCKIQFISSSWDKIKIIINIGLEYPV